MTQVYDPHYEDVYEPSPNVKDPFKTWMCSTCDEPLDTKEYTLRCPYCGRKWEPVKP